MRFVLIVGCFALVAAQGCDKKSDKAAPAAVKSVKKDQTKAPQPTAKAAPTTADNESPAAAAKPSDGAERESVKLSQSGAPATVAATSSQPSEGAVECGGAAETVAKASGAGAAGGGEEGCIYGADEKQNQPHIAKTAVGHYGAPFTLGKAVPVSQVLSKTAATSDKLVKVSGKIASVCVKKGCWMVVTDGKMKARIKMKNYGFTVPTDSKGKQTVIEGTVSVKTWTEAQVKHLEEDAGRDPSKVKGTRKEYLLTATGIDIKG